MFVGHFALGLAAKPIAPKASLGVLLISTQVIDILYAIFLVTGISREGAAGYWDHGLIMTGVWSAAGFAIALLFSRNLRSSAVIGLLIFSHWVGDFFAWDHILPLAFEGSPLVGLGLYNQVAVMITTDFGLFGAAIAIYLLRTRAKDRTGTLAFWLMVAYILAMIPACTLQGKLIIIVAILIAALLPFGIWIDRHRSVISAGKRASPD
jgi:hypothetical protein